VRAAARGGGVEVEDKDDAIDGSTRGAAAALGGVLQPRVTAQGHGRLAR
jgi:hypothetical protein